MRSITFMCIAGGLCEWRLSHISGQMVMMGIMKEEEEREEEREEEEEG